MSRRRMPGYPGYARSAAPVALVALLASGLAAGCSGPPVARPTASSPTSSSTPTVQQTSSVPTTRPTSIRPTSARPAPPRPRPTARAAPTTPSRDRCGQLLAAAMTPAQRAGQLLMVGLDPGMSVSATAAQVRREALGGVIYVGGWSSGASFVAGVSARLQAAAGGRLLLADDQEGGAVQQLRGPGFPPMPSARVQGTTGTLTERRNAEAWARQLLAAGVTVDLAPVADTVPTWLGAANQPIGRYNRDFVRGAPSSNGRYAAAFVRGMVAGGVAPSVKHFPGLGRVRGNTDTSSTGITDSTTSATDPYLAPFQAAIGAGAPLVMVSSAFYPRLDRVNQAVFSASVITGLLRGRLGFGGVVVSDDLGVAASVGAVPVGQRATRFIAAGGDIVLTTAAAQAPAMLAAIAARRAASRSFAARVDDAAARVLELKARLRLVRCPG